MEDDIHIVAIDRNFWAGKQGVKMVDLERAHLEVAKLEEDANRALRAINRRVGANTKRLNELTSEMNTNMGVLSARINTIGQQPNHSLPNNGQNNESGGNEEEVNTLSGFGRPDTFSEESVIAFDRWSEKFTDYLAAAGRNLTEADKVACMRWALADTPRMLFKQLTESETATLKDAIAALRTKLDSPQRREISKRALAVCKQKETESVSDFLKRLIPLVETVNPLLNEEAMKEKVCEEFLDGKNIINSKLLLINYY